MAGPGGALLVLMQQDQKHDHWFPIKLFCFDRLYYEKFNLSVCSYFSLNMLHDNMLRYGPHSIPQHIVIFIIIFVSVKFVTN